jgi:DNA-cytosine methyltransferase
MNALSLFNGMSCGMMALEELSINIDNYYSCEIDKFANQATEALYPEIKHLGDVTKWQEWGIDLSSVDLLMAGFPCQAWSMAGKQKGDNDPRGALVHDLINIWNAINTARSEQGKEPVKFLFENVKMKKEFLDYINNLFGVEPVFINSALVSAQNRQRYYWTNIDEIEQPEDKGILLADILETGVVDQDKSYCIDANYFKGGNLKSYFEKHRRQLVFMGGTARVSERGRRLTVCGTKRDDKHGEIVRGYEVASDNKTCCLTTVQKDNYIAQDYTIRKLTPRECMRLQTIPEHHIDTLLNSGISNTQLYKMAGNGWTVDVISHILKGLNK